MQKGILEEVYNYTIKKKENYLATSDEQGEFRQNL
jgi:hypothetical protein